MPKYSVFEKKKIAKWQKIVTKKFTLLGVSFFLSFPQYFNAKKMGVLDFMKIRNSLNKNKLCYFFVGYNSFPKIAERKWIFINENFPFLYYLLYVKVLGPGFYFILMGNSKKNTLLLGFFFCWVPSLGAFTYLTIILPYMKLMG
jgi:hypothetical protein